MAESKIDLISRIREIYINGGNIIQYLRNQSGRSSNTIEDILMSYDFQAGTYIEFTKGNSAFNTAYTCAIATVLNRLGRFNSLLEVGVGEATTLGNVLPKIAFSCPNRFGLDISWSRVKFGVDYLREKDVKADLLVADMFSMPFEDDAIDVVYTSHSVEPNGGRETEALTELYRVARKYLVLLEPTDEFATADGKIRMRRNGYIQNVKRRIEELGYDLVEYRPFDFSVNPLNPTGLYVIRKAPVPEKKSVSFFCPMSKQLLVEYLDHFYCPASLVSYPKIMGIPCLCPSYGVLTSRHP